VRSNQQLINLKDRVALVTGATGHVGYAACETLAEAGASLVVSGTSKSKCDKLARDIQKKFKCETLSLPVNLMDPEAAKKLAESIGMHFSHLDIIVHAAAVTHHKDLDGWLGKFSNQKRSIWQEVLHLNLTSFFEIVQSCEKLFTKKSSLIAIGSIYGMVGPDMRLYEGSKLGNSAAYAASKGGLIQFVRWLSTVLAPHTRVNTLSPGGIFRDHSQTFVSQYKARTPLNRMATEEDLKGAILYLASDMSSYVTGHNLVVDGGWSVW